MQTFSEVMLLKRNCRCKTNKLQDKNGLGQETQELITSSVTSYNEMHYCQAKLAAKMTPKFRSHLAGGRFAEYFSGGRIRPWFVCPFVSVKRLLIEPLRKKCEEEQARVRHR